MRIFCAVRHALSPESYYGGLWSANFYPALLELGHEIVESQTDLRPLSRFMHIADTFTAEELEARSRITESILSEVARAHRERPVDLFLSYFYNAHFDPAGFADLRKLGIPTTNFYCNSIHQFPLVEEIAKAVDFSWHAERDARQSYLNAGARPVWVQMGADPKVYHPVGGVGRASKTFFMGQRYADRDRWALALMEAGVPIDLYGSGWEAPGPSSTTIETRAPGAYLGRKIDRPGSLPSYVAAAKASIGAHGIAAGGARMVRQWIYRRQTARISRLLAPHAKGTVPFDRLNDVFAGYEVCVNFSNVWADARSGSRLVSHVRLRDFEAPMCRTCYLTAHSDEIQEFYEVGREIDTYSTPEELVDKARHYLENKADAERLREAGYRRALRDHTWVRRFEQLFLKLNLARTARSAAGSAR